MKLILLLLALISPLDAAFTYSRTITVNTGQVSSGAHSNFPMLVAGTYSYLAHTGSGGKVTSTSGYDIGFYSNSNCSTGKLDWETAKYTSATGAVVYWVEVASLNDGSVIYMCYGDSGITTDQSNKTGVWDSNYKGVWHVNETSGSHLDSTSNANDSSAISAATQGSGTGIIDGADVMTGAGNKVTVASASSMAIGASAFTLSAWVKFTTITGGFQGLIAQDGSINYVALMIDGTGKIRYHLGGSVFVGSTSPTTGVWYYVVVTLTTQGGTATLYINGASDGSGTSPNQSVGTAGSTYFCGDGAGILNGTCDEARYSVGVARSAGWIATEYNNQSAPSTFYAVGSEVGGSTRVVRRVNNQ